MLDKEFYKLKDIAYIFKGYSTTKLKGNIENAINTVEDKFETIFFDCATGALADNFKKIKSNDLYSISAREKDGIISTTAKTFNKAVDLLIIEGKEEKEIAEARKIWAN